MNRNKEKHRKKAIKLNYDFENKVQQLNEKVISFIFTVFFSMITALITTLAIIAKH